MSKNIQELLGKDADGLLSYKAKFPKEKLHLPGPDFVDRIFARIRQKHKCFKKSSVALYGWSFGRNRLCFDTAG